MNREQSRKPIYRIMNESFRRFIQGGEHGVEIAQWEKREKQRAWRAFQFSRLLPESGHACGCYIRRPHSRKRSSAISLPLRHS